nr:hypothetical protein CFP56_11827 [Quercus suber]
MADEDDYPNFSSAFSYAAVPTPPRSPRVTLQQQRSSSNVITTTTPRSSSPRHRPRPISMPSHGLRNPFAHQRGKSSEPSLQIQFRSHHDKTPPKPKQRFTLQAITSGTIARRRAGQETDVKARAEK